MFRILLADDHPILLLGLSTLLGARPGWEVCGEAVDGRDAVEKCRKLKPDLLILDICLPELNGVDAARQILKHNPDQVILVLTSVDSEQVVRDCLEIGVRGWVSKSDGTDDVITAVEALQRRKSIFSSRVSNLIVDGYKRHGVDPLEANLPKLSPREREVVQLVSEGRASKEIATILNVTLGTFTTGESNIRARADRPLSKRGNPQAHVAPQDTNSRIAKRGVDAVIGTGSNQTYSDNLV
jgi:DNA-binding NarL/FixJ family response regulator